MDEVYGKRAPLAGAGRKLGERRFVFGLGSDECDARKVSGIEKKSAHSSPRVSAITSAVVMPGCAADAGRFWKSPTHGDAQRLIRQALPRGQAATR